MTDPGWGDDEQLEDDLAIALEALIATLASLSGVTITNQEHSAGRWIVRGTIDRTADGLQSLSIITFVAERRVSGVALDVGPGSFSLEGVGGPPIELAWEIEFGRGIIREREARN
jgi:hypothetical protein